MSNENNGLNGGTAQQTKDAGAEVPGSDSPGDEGPVDDAVEPGQASAAILDEATGEPVLGIEELRQSLDAARAEAGEYKDQYLRAKAEAENIRRRADQARISARKYAHEEFARELLDVRDSLDHAGNLEMPTDIAPEHAGALKQMSEGLDLTLRQIDAAFSKFNVLAVDPKPGEKFDPTAHQATSTQPAEGIAANHIVAVFRKGYRLHDRLLRPAMVVVASAPPGSTAQTTAQTDSVTDADAGEASEVDDQSAPNT